ncbi:MAG: DUF2505 domain-containing protein [Deltaproteobacteria bacterium]|nr:DUF2505 domain-containing protein [Deltaproteobacteria bacterium]MCB9785110.1 DUF2505 domain-containing protein [Deltaproteobacteria bacterium]
MKTTSRFALETDAETYWHEVYFDPEFTRALYLEGLGCDSVEVLESWTDDQGRYHRQLLAQPHLDAPAFIQKLFGDSQQFTDDGTFDPASGRWSYRVIPAKLATKIHIEGSQRTVATPGGMELLSDLDVRVDVVGFGGLVEKFIVRQFEEKLAQQERFSRRWLASHPG